MKQSAILLFLSSVAAWAQCSVAVTAPPNNTVVSGPTTFTSALTSCPSAVRVEYRLDGAKPDGEGTTETAYSAAGPNYRLAYNVSYLWDGTHVLTAQALDSSGTVLATSSPVNLVLNDRNIGTMALALAGTSGNIRVTLTPNLIPSSNPDLSSVIADAAYYCYVDGTFVFGGGLRGVPSFTAPMSFTIPSAQYENGIHNLICGMRTLDRTGSPAAMPSVGAQKSFAVDNGSANRELRLNYSTVFLWLGGTKAAALSPRFTRSDNSESAATATFSSDKPGVASVGSCVNVSSCAVTAVAAGLANITATNGPFTTTTRVVVQAGSPIAPHFSSTGQLLTSYRPGQSLISRSMFGAACCGASSAIYNPTVVAPLLLSSFQNTIEMPIYFNNVNDGHPSQVTWQGDFDGNVTTFYNKLMPYGFQSVLGDCPFDRSSQGLIAALQASNDSGIAARITYMRSKLTRIVACMGQDETPFWPIYPSGGGKIGNTNGPLSVTVSGTAATINMPPTWNGWWGKTGDIRLSSNPCLNANNVAMGTPGANITYNATGCPPGTYTTTAAPTGIPETGLTLYPYNRCPGNVSCENYGLENRPVPPTGFTSWISLLHNNGIEFAFPGAGGAPGAVVKAQNGVIDGVRVSGYSNNYWTTGATGAQLPGFPNSWTVQQGILSMEQNWWNTIWPNIDQTRPATYLIQTSGAWYSSGGFKYALATSSGSTFQTALNPAGTVPRWGAPPHKVTVTGGACPGNYDTTFESGTTFTVKQSPGCAGSGGTAWIGTGLYYYYPPADVQRGAGAWRGVNIVSQAFDALALGAIAGLRAFSYDAGYVVRTNYPDTDLQAYTNSAVQYLDSGQTGWSVADISPSSQERYTALKLAFGLIGKLEPDILQPSCSAPNLGSHIHTGARCGSRSNLVIAISDIESANSVHFTFGSYNLGGGAITRYEIVNGDEIRATQLSPTAPDDSFVLDGPEVVLWQFPSSPAAVPSTLVTLRFNPASAGGTKTAFRYAYDRPTLEWQSKKTVFGSSASMALDLRLGAIVYTTQYLDSSNVPVGPESALQILSCPSSVCSLASVPAGNSGATAPGVLH